MTTHAKKFTIATEKEYYTSGDWKCPESPTGAHWWNCNVEPSFCKICGKVKIVTSEVIA